MGTDTIDFTTNSQLAENAEIELENPAILDDSYEKKRMLLEKTKIVKQTWSILEIYQKVKDNKLILDPDYQRNDIWKNDKQTAFIESLFMGIIIPPIYVVEISGENILEENTYEVVDGKQRLSTILKFLKNELFLQDKSLEYYADWFAGKGFTEIQSAHNELTTSMLSSVLDIYVITANSPEFTKYDIFSRLNKGSEPLKVNEIRRAIYQSATLKSITKYVEGKVNKSPYNMIFSDNDIKRYEDYGRFYRSIAFYIRTDTTDWIVKGYNSRPREMINDVLFGLQEKSISIEPVILQSILDQTIQIMLKLSQVKNSAYIVDACIYFAVQNPEKLMTKLDAIVKDAEIVDSLEKSPSTTSNVNARLKRIKEIVS